MLTKLGVPHCFIMSAGMGTRMGEIGKVLPKVLWPVFEKKILDLQVSFAGRLGFQRIFVNTHHGAKEVEQYCQRLNPRP
ncbi:MAG: NTP transferase domain-containing protein, partial [Pseudomonadota bacterium]